MSTVCTCFQPRAGTVECPAMWDIIGQERAVDALSRAIAGGRLPHALLFTGPNGVGKTRLALELARALNCTGTEPPCGVCLHCRQIQAGSHPDVTVVERPEDKDSITIQQVRELREVASLRPFQASHKVYIIAGAEALTAQAADALLKTLEEPQPQLTLVLTAAEDDALPGTIVSRCRVIALQPVETPTIVALLERNGVDGSTAARIARLARGSVGWALEAARQPKTLKQREEMVARLAGILDLDLEERLRLVETLTGDKKERAAVRRTVEIMVLLARDLLLISQGVPPRLSSGAERARLEGQAARLDLRQIHAYLRGLQTAMRRIDQNVDPRLALEALLVAAP
jgi:DNA polymerase-3 subunit delta'